MPPIHSNANRDGSVVIRSTSAEKFQMSDFATVADVAGNVVVSDVSILKVAFSTDGHIVIGKETASGNVVIFNLSWSGTFDLDGMSLSTNSAADFPQCNLYITHRSGNSVAIIKLKKHTVPQGEAP